MTKIYDVTVPLSPEVPTYPGDDALMRGALFRELLPSLDAVTKTLSDIMRA